MLFKEKSWNQSHKKLKIPNISENTCSFYASPVFIEILGFLGTSDANWRDNSPVHFIVYDHFYYLQSSFTDFFT